ncbi:MAG: glycosyltransferase family 39 protein [Pseudomonadota bacterium]
MLDSLDSILTRLAERKALSAALLLVLALAVLSPFVAQVPPIDRDEVLFSQASRQMAGSGDFVDIRFGDGTRYKKTIGIYWLQASAAKVFGAENAGQIWVYRTVSVAAAAISVLLTAAIGRVLASPQVGFGAALGLAGVFVLGAEARLAKTDAALLCTILVAQYPLARLWVERKLSAPLAWLFWAGLGASVLVKGPIGPLAVGSTVLVLSGAARGLRWLAPLRPVRGLLLFLLIVLPWFIAISFVAGQAYWSEALGRDMLGKITTAQESHGAPPGSYLLGVWATFWPMAILIPLAVGAVWRHRKEAVVVFCLAWTVPFWIGFELVSTKLIHYVMPTYPALAILVALGWQERQMGGPRIWEKAVVAALLLIGPVFLAAALCIGLQGNVRPGWEWGLALLLYVAGAYILWTTVQRAQILMPFLAMAVLGLSVAMGVYGHLSRVPALWPAVQVRDMAAVHRLCDDQAIRSIGYREPSLLFLTQDWSVVTEAPDLSESLRGHSCALVFVEDRERDGAEAAMAQIAPDRQALATFEGFDLGKGREISMTLWALPAVEF